MNDYLNGTRPFPVTETLWNHNFKDRYAKQWQSTLQWMEETLRKTAAERDEQRGATAQWRAERRNKLRELTGIGLFESAVSDTQLIAGDDGGLLYEIRLHNGVVLTGSVSVPDRAGTRPSGVVLLIEPQETAADSARRYTEQGFVVIRPSVARDAFSFAEHAKRRWYKYEDHELVHFFAFICGGSLAGLEAFGLYTAVSRLTEALELDRNTAPIAVDARGRHLLSASVMAAVYPGTVQAMRLDAQTERLNNQESDSRSNTIWSFHRYFDALTLFQLAEGTDLLFVENGATASAYAAQAIHWFGHGEAADGGRRSVVRTRSSEAEQAMQKLLAAKADQPGEPESEHDGVSFAQTILRLGGGDNSSGERQRIECGDRASTDRYMLYLDSVHTLLESLHEQASERKRSRYNVRQIGIDAYKERIRQSLITVMGTPLPRSSDLNVRTRRVADSQSGQLNMNAYDTYEVLLESVPGVDTAGYLLMPKGAGPFPAVVCQHGLTGRPEDVIGLTHKRASYYRIAHILAEKGYAVYVPFMNWGWGGMPGRDRLTKHAFALGITPNRFEVAQLAGIVDFLQSRSEVKPDRIGFYGLSYGGHASVWLGACEPRLAAVITSGHFNNWHKKLTCTEAIPPHKAPTSYICVNEGMDMFTYNVLNELGHTEMTTVHAPRPYMVENGIWDGVAPVPWVDEEFAKVANVFAYLQAEHLAELNHFDGGHRVWGEESLLFLRKHLR